MEKTTLQGFGDALGKVLPVLTFSFLLSLLYIVAVNILSQNHFFLCDHPHDFFIPVNAGYAFNNGYALHENFHTPFGWIYAALNAAGLNIIELFPAQLSLNNFLSITSAIIALSGFLLFIPAHHFTATRNWNAFLLILTFAVSTIFQFKSRMDLAFIDVSPAMRSIYNNHLWGLSMLQVAHALFFMKGINSGTDTNKKRNIILAAIIQAVFLYISFNYKISFLAGALLIAASFIFLLNLKEATIYTLTGALFSALLMIITAASGYSFAGYANDLATALEAKKSLYDAYSANYHELKKLGAQVMVFDLSQLIPPVILSIVLFAYYFLYKKQFSSPLSLLRIAPFIVLVIFSAYANLKGDYDKPYIFMLVVALFFIFLNPLKRIGIVTTPLIQGFILFLVFINVFSISVMTRESNSIDKGLHFMKFKMDAQNSSHRFDFIILDRISTPESYVKILSDNPVYDTYKPLEPHFSKYVKLVYQNENYAKMLPEVMEVIKGMNIDKSEKLYFYEFTNPLPFLTNSAIPPQSVNWQHVGITLAPQSINKLHPSASASDAIIMPRMSGNGNAQQFMNCDFYKWNFANNNHFKIFKVTENAVYFGTDKFITKHGLHEVYNLDKIRDTLPETCDEVKKQFLDFFWTYPS